MIKKLVALQEQAKSEIMAVKTMHHLNEVKALYLGKKSPLQEILQQMKDLTVEEKKKMGIAINAFKQAVEEAVLIKRDLIEKDLINERLEKETIDISLPGVKFKKANYHPLELVTREIEEIFIGMGYNIAVGPEVELDLYNFEMLNLPAGHPAREMQDSFYINPTTLLRTHTSPVQARTMLENQNKPIQIICPGKVYRRDDDDATHSHQFMQVEGLVLGSDISLADLKGTLEYMLKKLFGGDRTIRFRPSYFPFTEPSVEVDVSCFKCNGKGCALCKQNGWIEILGAGMVHPNVLTMAGYDPEKFQGFAFGIGIERVTMLKYGIDDIRHFYTNDIRFLKQF